MVVVVRFWDCNREFQISKRHIWRGGCASDLLLVWTQCLRLPLFSWAREFTFFTQYWVYTGTDSSVLDIMRRDHINSVIFLLIQWLNQFLESQTIQVNNIRKINVQCLSIHVAVTRVSCTCHNQSNLAKQNQLIHHSQWEVTSQATICQNQSDRP